MKTKLLYIIILGTLSFQTSFAQFTLGDIVFTGYQSDSTGNPTGEDDQFSFLLLRDVVAGEQIAFTENGWLAAGGFRPGESTATLTFATNYNAGVQISIARIPFEARDNSGNIAGNLTGSGLNLAVGGDQILAYDPANVPNSLANQSGFVAAIQMNGDWDADATSASESAKPSIFDTLANSAIAIAPEVDNGIYNCSLTSGTATALRASVHNPANWNVSDTTPFDQPAPCSFMPTLSVANFSVLDNTLSVYPNPTKGIITIKNTGISLTKISVADANGRIVYAEKLNNVKTDKTLNLSNVLTPGLYFITCSTEGSSIVKKMIVN